MKKIGLYVHIQYCIHKCHYCDFISFSGKEETIKTYIETLKKESGASIQTGIQSIASGFDTI